MARLLARLEALEGRILLSSDGQDNWLDLGPWDTDSTTTAPTETYSPSTTYMPDEPPPPPLPDSSPEPPPPPLPEDYPTDPGNSDLADAGDPFWSGITIGIGVGIDDSGGHQAVSIAPDGYEPDNIPAYARPIRTDGTPQYHTLHSADDVDWVYFDLPTRAEVVIAAGDGQSCFASTLYSGTDLSHILAYDAGSGGHGWALLNRSSHYALPAGRYFVEVNAAGELSDDYELLVDVQLAPQPAADAAFSEPYYVAHNPDVAAAVGAHQLGSAWQHYRLYGAHEGRDASPLFSEAEYRAMYPDVAAAISAGVLTSGLEHYLRYGQYEQRNPLAAFDAAYYLAHNPDVARAVTGHTLTAYEHFLRYGEFEGRQPAAAFNESAYRARNPDVAAAVAAHQFATGWDHFIRYGRWEGRLSA